MRHAFAAPLALSLFAAACSSAPPPPARAPGDRSRAVFDAVVPSVVAVLNDDQADRDQEVKELEQRFGKETRAPKRVVDVSLRKEPMPHGTGFVIEGGRVVTAAHVLLRPDRLKLTTRAGVTVDADVDYVDEIRDVAILKPRQPLTGVPPLPIDQGEVKPGSPVWALGHTGQGLWALSWGISQGIASGTVDMVDNKLLLFDAAVYPGFSGGPVVTVDEKGAPKVLGVNHAILFTGSGFVPVASISSATAASALREVVAGHAHPLEAKLADYAKSQRGRTYADLFIANDLSVYTDPHKMLTASIRGQQRLVKAHDGHAAVPVAAMVFGLPPGEHEIEYELDDPDEHVMQTQTRTVNVAAGQRVVFSNAFLFFSPPEDGKYHVHAKAGGKEIGYETVWVDVADDDDGVADLHDTDSGENGDPDVDIVVAAAGNDDPLELEGIRSAWVERSYPRRVTFTWFARGTRGWRGTNVVIKAFVLDKDGHVVGAAPGCYKPELRPELSWSCINSGGTPLAPKQGAYDIVFAINDRPVAWWPMEAVIDTGTEFGLGSFLRELARQKPSKPPKHAAPPGTPATPPAAPGKPAITPKGGAPAKKADALGPRR